MDTSGYSKRLSLLGNALATAVSSAVITAAAVIVGMLVAREFGRGPETDGFFAAYGVYIVLVLVAGTLRVVVLPPLVRGRIAGRLPSELNTYAFALALVCVPLLVLSSTFPEWPAALLTSNPEARETAADAIVWLVPAAVAQIYAGLAASALAAADGYLVAATGFAAGAVGGLVVVLLRLDTGILSLAEGIAVNGVISLLVPLAVLGLRSTLVVSSPRGLAPHRRLDELARGVAVPIAVQGLFLIGLRSAGELGPGQQTSFSYAFLIVSSLVAVTASSFSLVSSAPLTRHGLTAVSAARHVRATVWLSVVPIAIVAGVFAVSGEAMLRVALGGAFEGEPGLEAGRLVLYLAPWMFASARRRGRVPAPLHLGQYAPATGDRSRHPRCPCPDRLRRTGTRKARRDLPGAGPDDDGGTRHHAPPALSRDARRDEPSPRRPGSGVRSRRRPVLIGCACSSRRRSGCGRHRRLSHAAGDPAALRVG